MTSNSLQRPSALAPAPGLAPVLLIACALLALLFALRPIPLTSDDEFYLEYFSGYREFGDDLLFAIIDEPVFKLYTNALYGLFSPEFNTRLLILLTVVPHALVARALGGWRGWLYVACYFLFVELAPHLSWVQLRQGFAVGLLALFFHVTRERWRVGTALVLGLVHTSLLMLLPCFAIGSMKNRRLAYGIVIGLALVLVALPDLASLLSFGLGRRESAYLDEAGTYSASYVIFSAGLIGYVTWLARDGSNDDRLLVYHAICALVLPMFYMNTFGAFAERLYFVARWYEVSIVVRSQRPRAALVGAGYLALNLVYTVYHAFANYGSGGFLDRYLSLLG